MTPAALLAFILAMIGRPTVARAPDGVIAFRDAIIAATSINEEQRVLSTVAFRENFMHLHSERRPFTPPFGLTHRESIGLPRLSIAASAVVALRVLHHHRARCTRLRAPGWGPALGRYHHGNTGPREGCYVDRLARIELRDARVNEP